MMRLGDEVRPPGSTPKTEVQANRQLPPAAQLQAEQVAADLWADELRLESTSHPPLVLDPQTATPKLELRPIAVPAEMTDAYAVAVDREARHFSQLLQLGPDQLSPRMRRALLVTLEKIYEAMGNGMYESTAKKLPPDRREQLERLLAAGRAAFGELLSVVPERHRDQVSTMVSSHIYDFAVRAFQSGRHAAAFLEDQGATHVIGVAQAGTPLGAMFARSGHDHGWTGRSAHLVPLARDELGVPLDWELTCPPEEVPPGSILVLVEDVVVPTDTMESVNRWMRRRHPEVTVIWVSTDQHPLTHGLLHTLTRPPAADAAG